MRQIRQMERIKKYSNISGTACMYAKEKFVNNPVCLMQPGRYAAMKNQCWYTNNKFYQFHKCPRMKSGQAISVSINHFLKFATR